ncbi:hypothetical protein CAPTEDRAFT_200571 [Capitella teleta]|uniref:Uncharacterized protein n=1 Tax=Capitella teleta TaxID=283909 RepID=R7T8C7_CAPTE|nr:hypothetical protein CAPTEDRAFT_200571 [Capitella teleta]|eukprot:ELT89880.1 hypothetical protein CAPTEDRAFT_200571 [Capitella teleta]
MAITSPSLELVHRDYGDDNGECSAGALNASSLVGFDLSLLTVKLSSNLSKIRRIGNLRIFFTCPSQTRIQPSIQFSNGYINEVSTNDEETWEYVNASITVYDATNDTAMRHYFDQSHEAADTKERCIWDDR